MTGNGLLRSFFRTKKVKSPECDRSSGGKTVYQKKAIAAAEKAGTEYVFVEAALLIEEKYDEICDELWYIYADEEVRKERLIEGRGYSEKKVREIMANQLSEDEFSSHCDFEIDNSGDFEKQKNS